MSVMDIFRIIFEADSADAAAAKTEHLKDIVKGTGLAADEAKKAFLGFGNGLVGTIAKFTSFAGIMSAVIGQIHSAFAKIPEIQDLNTQANRYGTNAGDLDLYQRAMVKNGATADDAAGLIKQLNDTIAGTGHGAKLAQAGLNGLGIATKNADGSSRDMVSILRDVSAAAHKGGANVVALSDQFRKMGLTQAEAMKALLAGKMTLSDAMEKQKELGYWTHETTQDVLEYSKAQGRLNIQLKYGLTQAILDYALPAITKIYQYAGDFIFFLRQHETFTKAFFLGIASVIIAFTLPAILRLTWATARWLLMFADSPIGLAIMAIILLAAVIDDLYNYIEGKNSVIGYIIGDNKELLSEVNTAIANLARFKKAVTNALEGHSKNALVDTFTFHWGNLASDFQTSWGKFQAAWQQSWQNAKNAFSDFESDIKDEWNSFIGYLLSKVADLVEKIHSATGALGGMMDWAGKHDTDAYNAQQAQRKADWDKGFYAPLNNNASAKNPLAVQAATRAQAKQAHDRLQLATSNAAAALPGWAKYAGGGIWAGMKEMFAYNNRLGGNKITNNINESPHITINGVAQEEIVRQVNEAMNEHLNKASNALITATDSAMTK